MWNAYAKFERLTAAMRMRRLNPKRLDIGELFSTLEKRGVTDRRLNNLVWDLIALLEPPACDMTHCKEFGGQGASCNCIAGKIPGRCRILRAFHKRKEARSNTP
jgi:hypothetical protein